MEEDNNKATLEEKHQTFVDTNFTTIVELFLEEQAAITTVAARLHSIDQIIASLIWYSSLEVHKSRDTLPFTTAQLAIWGVHCIIAAKKSSSKKKNEACVRSENVVQHPSMLGSEEREHVKDLVTSVQLLIKQNRFSAKTFTKLLLNLSLDDLCLEVLWFLHTRNIVPFITCIISFNNRPEVIEGIRDAIMQLLVSLADDDQCKVMTDLLAVLLKTKLSQNVPICAELSAHGYAKMCSAMLDSIIEKTTNLLMDTCTENTPSGIHFTLLKRHLSATVYAALLDQFMVSSFYSILQNNQDVTDTEIIEQQTVWIQEKLPHNMTMFLENLLQALGAKNALKAIGAVLEGGNFSWKLLLGAVAILLANEPLSATLLKGLVKRLLHQAFSSYDSCMLTTVFLLVREACTQPSHIFQSYSDWFGATFGSEGGRHLLLNTSQRSFKFLLQFLTNIVPHERALYLKVHINKVPLAPPNCCGMLADYNQLAKTRLKDLGQSSGTGLFGFELTSKEDILRALDHFEQTGGVSNVILNATVFRRQQYEEDFLPHLLQPRCLPQPLDTRAQFIEKLYQMGKISHILYSKYEANCLQAALYDTEDGLLKLQTVDTHVFSHTEWTECMTQLTTTVKDYFEIKPVDPKDKKVLLQSFENIKFNAATVLKDFNTVYQGEDSGKLINMVVDIFLDAFIQCFTPPGLGDTQTWPGVWLSLLHPFPKLWQPLNNATEDFCFKNNGKSSHQILAAAVLVLTMHSQGNELKSPSLAETLSCRLPLTDHCQMLYYFKFAVQYMQQAELQITLQDGFTMLTNDDVQVDTTAARLQLESLVPMELLRKYLFLLDRLPHTGDPNVPAILNSSWRPQMRNGLWTTFILKAEISLQYWLQLEFEARDELADVEWLRYAFLWLKKYCIQTQLEVMYQLLKSSLDYATSTEGRHPFSKRLLSLLSCALQHDTSVPFLLQAWKDLIPVYKHEDIFRAVQSLPASQLFAGYVGVDVHSMKMAVTAFSEFITCYLRDIMAQKGFLPFAFVHYVLMGLANNYIGQSSIALTQLLDSCPAFHVAVLTSSTPNNTTMRIQKLIALVLPHADSSVSLGSPSNDLLILLPQCQDWEVGLLLWCAGDCSISGKDAFAYRNLNKMFLSMDAWLPSNVPYWFFLFSIVEFGNLLLEGKMSVMFVGDSIEFIPVKNASYDGSALDLTCHLLRNSRVLMNLDQTFNCMDQTLGALSSSALVMTAVATVLLLMSVQPQELLSLLMDKTVTVLYCHILSTCFLKWKSVNTNSSLWCQLNSTHQCKMQGADLNLLKIDFVSKMTKCIELRSFTVAKKHNILTESDKKFDMWMS